MQEIAKNDSFKNNEFLCRKIISHDNEKCF